MTAEKLPATTVGRLVDTRFFKVDKGHRSAGTELLLRQGQLQTLVMLSGGGRIESSQAETVEFSAGDCLIVPAQFEGAALFAEETEYLTVTL